jgi:hypothetical protein
MSATNTKKRNPPKKRQRVGPESMTATKSNKTKHSDVFSDEELISVEDVYYTRTPVPTQVPTQVPIQVQTQVPAPVHVQVKVPMQVQIQAVSSTSNPFYTQSFLGYNSDDMSDYHSHNGMNYNDQTTQRFPKTKDSRNHSVLKAEKVPTLKEMEKPALYRLAILEEDFAVCQQSLLLANTEIHRLEAALALANTTVSAVEKRCGEAVSRKDEYKASLHRRLEQIK